MFSPLGIENSVREAYTKELEMAHESFIKNLENLS